jgi:hypothetical protein
MKPRLVLLFTVMVMLLTALSGCSGTMKGVVRRDARRIQITFTDARIGEGHLQTVLPGGERFEGRLTKPGSPESLAGANAGAASFNFEAVDGVNGNAEAVLAGDRGNFIKCRFRLSDTIIGLSAGGSGLCQVTDGRVIDVFF